MATNEEDEICGCTSLNSRLSNVLSLASAHKRSALTLQQLNLDSSCTCMMPKGYNHTRILRRWRDTAFVIPPLSNHEWRARQALQVTFPA